jgi:hypothetical protein
MLLQSSSMAQTPQRDSKSEAQHPEDLSNWLGLLMAAEGAGGWYSNPSPRPSAYGGVKLGLPVIPAGGKSPSRCYDLTLDLGYDRLKSHNAFAGELSTMLPLFRLPGPQKDEKRNFLRVYAEPGIGYRTGGIIGGYASAKLMFALFSDYRLTSSRTLPSPFLEVQRRFPFGSPLQADNRIAMGLMIAICNQCGLE